jgi:hypothetical protein
MGESSLTITSQSCDVSAGVAGAPTSPVKSSATSTAWSPVPVTVVYGDHDWSREPEREANLALLPGAHSTTLSDTGLRRVGPADRAAELLLAGDP